MIQIKYMPEKFEKQPGEISKEESEIPERKTNRPEAKVPEWQLWQEKLSKDEKGKMFARGVRSPDGNYHKLEKGEKFVINKEDDGDYEAVALGPDGSKRVLKESLSAQKARVGQENEEALATVREKIEQGKETPYDRERLIEITKKCAERGALFGKDVNLGDEDKRQIEIVIQLVEEQINEAMKNDEEWKNFEKLENELTSKGIMTTDASYVDGGENVHVQQRKGDKSKGESPIQIVVPSRVYNLRYYRNVVNGTRDHYLKPSAEAIRGQSVKGLRDNLRSLSYFIKETERKK